MTAILAITFPIYAAIAIGYLAVRAGWFTPSDMRVLGQYVMTVALPALLFDAVASRDVAQVFEPVYMLAFLLGGLATIALGFAWFTLTGADRPRRAVAVMGMSCPNSGFIGFPVMLLLLPDQAGVILALNMLVENVVLIPICLILMDLARGPAQGGLPRRLAAILWGVLRRPMVIGLLLGLAVSLARVPIPEAGARLLAMLAASAAALSLVVIGGSLAGLPLRGQLARPLQIAAGKLLVHPAMVALAIALLGALGLTLSPDWQVAAILSAAMPMFGIYVVLAQEQGQEGMASVAMLLTTVLGFFTLSGFLAVLG
ncbi:hypothetical protein SAMN05444007_111107 [Cribrihabitans marinus]|uniref:Transporter n=1 Tax=Cribrihabitans marinus TaxID=1227549 RepID=A0A1H7DRA9_9RHOB|nr:AEC family transporter [Cribrihabitans marinus]GGH39196.1 permease [Cribrihabitans marinus]SEK00805.1 hypothetical protein SAMN05444007_111107 [Cribrihabitans marinus]